MKRKTKILTETLKNGDKGFYAEDDGYWHREDGPAVITSGGNKYWYINGEQHREDGPACEYVSGSKQWWLNDIEYTEQDWKVETRKRKLKELGL